MKILYLDTTSSFLYCAVLENNTLRNQIKEKLENNLSMYTLPKLHQLLSDCSISINDIDKIIAVNGPGSFTGIRIGLTIAKTIAWAKNIPIILVSSLEAMALSYDGDYNYIVPAIDARRNYLYASIYDTTKKSFIMKEQHISLDTLNIALGNLGEKISFITNNKIVTNYDIQPYDPKIEKIVKEVSDREPVNPHAVDANYLKLTEAEENKIKEEKYDS
jgi:tRNA threonylcarbamoyladenosine biosynthesis protein TsaB